MKQSNQGIQLFSNLLNQIADTKAELINPEDFADLSYKAYDVLLNDFEAYLFEEDVYHLNRYRELKEKLEVLVAKAEGIVTKHKVISGDINISPYRAGLAMFVNAQLAEALALIHPGTVKY